MRQKPLFSGPVVVVVVVVPSQLSARLSRRTASFTAATVVVGFPTACSDDCFPLSSWSFRIDVHNWWYLIIAINYFVRTVCAQLYCKRDTHRTKDFTLIIYAHNLGTTLKIIVIINWLIAQHHNNYTLIIIIIIIVLVRLLYYIW